MILAAVIHKVAKLFFQEFVAHQIRFYGKKNFIDICINTVTWYGFVRRGLLVNCQVGIFYAENKKLIVFLCQSLIVHQQRIRKNTNVL